MTKNKSGKKDNRENKPKKNKAKRMKKEAMLHSVMSVFQSSPKEPFNYKQISKLIGVESQVQKLQVVDLLYDLSADNFITEIDRGRYRSGYHCDRYIRTPEQREKLVYTGRWWCAGFRGGTEFRTCDGR